MERIGFFFEAVEWEEGLINTEPEKRMALTWFTVHDLPSNIMEYPEASLRGYLDESDNLLTEHAWSQ